MAIFHLCAKIISRKSGRSAIAAAAYRAGCEIVDQRTGLVHDYTRKRGVDHTEIVAPSGAPDWVFDRSELWNRVEESEKRKDSQLAREIEISIPRELPIPARFALVREYARLNFADSGMVADVAFHHAADINHENPHAHIMLTMRDLTSEGFGKKNRDWNEPDLVEHWRSQWADLANKYLAENYSAARIDHRSFERQGVTDRLATKHMGSAAAALEARGIATEVGDYNREVQAYNALVDELATAPEYVEAPDLDLLNAVEADMSAFLTRPAPTWPSQPEAAKPKPKPTAAPTEAPKQAQAAPNFHIFKYLGSKASAVLNALRAVWQGEKPNPPAGLEIAVYDEKTGTQKPLQAAPAQLQLADYEAAAAQHGRIDLDPTLLAQCREVENALTAHFSPQDWADPQARENAALEALEQVLSDRI